ncbi:hypothetical protein HHI36_007117 [Cryptolaemus montrouzieri]|uniref:Mitochondrial carrier protein n=1 Tax=Cryptolaemus montrouzieri TaxID=559131 RepID=A0ABD2MNN4_9CUCU
MKKKFLFHEKEFICGWSAAATNIVITYPIQKMSAFQVLFNENIIRASQCIFRECSVRSVYRGMLPPLCQKSISISCMFGFYNNLNDYLQTRDVKFARYWSGLASGSMESTTMPFERMQSILINKNFNKKYKNMLHIMLKLRKEYGIKEYYRGFSIIFFRNTMGNICFFTLKHECDFYITNNFQVPIIQSGAQFIYGGLIGSMLSTLFYPLTVLKLTLQKQVGGKFLSPLKTARELYSDGKN